MWLEIIHGIIIYQLFRRFFYGGNDVLDVETSDFNVIFFTEKLCGGKVYAGLNTPDADTGSRKSINIVLVTKGEAVVISVKNVSGFVSINDDGSWTSKGGRSHQKEHTPDPVSHHARMPTSSATQSILLLNFFNCSEIYRNFPPEVITYDQWVQLEPEPKGMIFGWVKSAFRGGKKEIQDSFHQQLNFILSTAPIWDRFAILVQVIIIFHDFCRLVLKESKHVLGEFLEFKGK
ncbi:hypothetical protein ES288_A08G115500v1 [Gossypium darwinii]|uniref:NERD domain-containing protein n=1 Tax=Gossypium darwinii TaxID=34276 RepID=A0A5D2FKA2_GOSDA|nr:hypothetical protein ES288_A08G115500v1 [Gossypium darwinii]